MMRPAIIAFLSMGCLAATGAVAVRMLDSHGVPDAIVREDRTMGSRGDEVLASAGGEVVTAAEFKEEYVDYLLRTGTTDAPRLRWAVLARMLNDRLLIADATQDGIEHTVAYRKHQETVRKKLSIELYIERQVLDTVSVGERDLEEAFVRMNTTVTARHLFARTLEQAERLYDRLTAGESFESLAREVFIDTRLANNGGSLGAFTFDEMDPDFEDAAFGLAVGEVSRPVRTAQGYSIIQVTDRFTKPILTETEFAERKERLRNLVLQKKRAQARSHFIRSTADALDIRLQEPAFSLLLGQITGSALIEPEEGDLALPLVEFAGGVWTLDEFRRRAADTDERHRAAVRTAADLKEFIQGLVVRQELLGRAEPLTSDPEFDAAVQHQMDEWVLEQKKEELAAAVQITDEDIRLHYASHPTEFLDDAGAPRPFEAVAPAIREQLRYTRTRQHVLEYVATLRQRHDVSLNESALLSLPIAGRSWEGLAARHPDHTEANR